MISTMKTYTGGCHCAKVRYEVDMEIDKVISCNCSICSKHGLLLTFVPATQFRLGMGEGDLSDYHFNTMRIRHRFCKECGVESFGMGSDAKGNATVAVNVRTIDGINLSELNIVPFDGKS